MRTVTSIGNTRTGHLPFLDETGACTLSACARLFQKRSGGRYFAQIAKVLDDTKADYVKMDMNRHLTDIWSKTAAEQNQGAILHRYVLGVYDFWNGCMNVTRIF